MAIKVGLDRKPTAAERRDAAEAEKLRKRAANAERALEVCFGGKWQIEEGNLQQLSNHVQSAQEKLVRAQHVVAKATTDVEKELAARKVGEASGCLMTLLADYHLTAERVRIDRLRRKVATEPGGVEAPPIV
jgi:hypothetical protein